MATWCVTSMVRASQKQLERFVKHYVGLGADRIYLFHDDPSFASIVEHRKVKNIVCDDGYWKGNRPDDARARQRANATKAFKWTDADWILHCDHDELILANQPVAEMLDALDDNVMSVMAPPMEAIYDAEPTAENCYDTPWFKLPMRISRHDMPWLKRLLSSSRYGTSWFRRLIEGKGNIHPVLLGCFGEAAYLTKRGFTGHLEGKSFTRRSLYAGRIPIHRHEVVPEGLVANVTLPGLALMHFDCLTFADWREKNLRRISKQIVSDRVPKLRALQWNAITEAQARGGDEALHQLYLRLNVLDAETISMAQRDGFIQFVERRLPEEATSGSKLTT